MRNLQKATDGQKGVSKKRNVRPGKNWGKRHMGKRENFGGRVCSIWKQRKEKGNHRGEDIPA